ncbi:24627_t:CDS:2 [Cetraspora pellucida]|uniref:24627_t:CDS:1 n=1 Tax=Cetraspora pellucida TaxID=1433469 RepID=A0A9N9AQ98_9GLOM|nr:24627_t:CDS:2 [Cetraspora pellucida]
MLQRENKASNFVLISLLDLENGQMCAPIKRGSFQNSEVCLGNIQTNCDLRIHSIGCVLCEYNSIENAELTCKCGMNAKK